MGLLHIGVQGPEIAVDCTHQLEVDKRLVEGSIAGSLSDTERRAVDDVSTSASAMLFATPRSLGPDDRANWPRCHGDDVQRPV